MKRMPLRGYGIDFSGARDAGNRIWIALRSHSFIRNINFAASGCDVDSLGLAAMSRPGL